MDPSVNVYQDCKSQIYATKRDNLGYEDRFYQYKDKIFMLLLGDVYNIPELINECEDKEYISKESSILDICSKLYFRYGSSFIKRLNGQFSLVLRDEKEDILIVAVDRFGLSRPVYYNVEKNFTYSSHLKTLLNQKTISSTIDMIGLSLFLKYAYIPSPKTIIKGISKLGPGEMIICRSDELSIIRYIDFKCIQRQMDEDEAKYEYLQLLSQSISRRLCKDNISPVPIFLSGGLDSSANVAIVSQLTQSPIETYGIGFEDPEMDERPHARLLAEHFRVPFYEYVFTGKEIEDLPHMIWHLEEPFMENGLFLTYAGFKSIKPNAKGVITGNCTDQLFGTGGFSGGLPIALRYIIEKNHLSYLVEILQTLSHTPLFYHDTIFFKIKVMLDRLVDFNNWFFWGFDDDQIKQLCKFPINDKDIKIYSNDISMLPCTLSAHYQHSLIHQDLEHYACQNVIVKTHRMAEMFGITAHDPYLDYDLVDFILKLELRLKRNGTLKDYLHGKTKTKYLHRLAMQKLLPKKILSKRKQGGSIVMSLLLSERIRRERIFEYIRKSRILKEYLRMGYIEKLLSRYSKDLDKKIYWQNYYDSSSNQILYLLTFALWNDIIIENRYKESIPDTLADMLP